LEGLKTARGRKLKPTIVSEAVSKRWNEHELPARWSSRPGAVMWAWWGIAAARLGVERFHRPTVVIRD
jgi:hypothetical protein